MQMHQGTKDATSLFSPAPALYGPYAGKHLFTGMACAAPNPPCTTARVDLCLSVLLKQFSNRLIQTSNPAFKVGCNPEIKVHTLNVGWCRASSSAAHQQLTSTEVLPVPALPPSLSSPAGLDREVETSGPPASLFSASEA